MRCGGIFAETEGFICAIQDQVVRTRAYAKHILKENISDRCRCCKVSAESIQHISGGCSTRAQTDYLQRHNSVAKVVHQVLAKQFGLVKEEIPYYKCKPDPVLQNANAKLLWDLPITTDRSDEGNRPDIVLVDKNNRTAKIIDIAVPLDNNIISTIAEKKRKYHGLAVELKNMWGLREVLIIPVVISSNGLVSKELVSMRDKLYLNDQHLRVMQKAAILATANIIRRFLDQQ